MGSFLTRLVIGALSLGLAAYIVPGIQVDGVLTLVIASFLLGLVNAVVRPILFIITLPITVVTLGLFLLVINAAMLIVVAWILPGFSITGFWAAFWGWLIMVLAGWIASQIVKRK